MRTTITTPTRFNIIDQKAYPEAMRAYNAFTKLKPGIYNANTYANPGGTPGWQFLQPDAVAQIVDCFAPLKSWALVYDPAPYSPQITNEIKFVTTATTTQAGTLASPITTYETGGSNVNAVAVPVTHYSQSWSVSNSDIQKGGRIEDLFLENALTLAQTVAGSVAANFVTTNFTTTPITQALSGFGLSNASSAFAGIKKAGKRSLVLSPEYYAQLSHTNGFTEAVKFGWDGIYAQSAGWSSAGANVYGVAAAPTAVLCVTGRLLPINTPTVRQEIVALGGLGIPIEYNRWYNLSTRSEWASLDVILGSAVADSSAAVLFKSA